MGAEPPWKTAASVAALLAWSCVPAASARADEPPSAWTQVSELPLTPSSDVPHRKSVTALLGVPRCTSKQLCWDPGFNRMDLPETIFTGAAGGVALAFNII